MNKKVEVITNNPMVSIKYKEKVFLKYYEITYLEILKKVRDKIHLGYKLLTHPLSGSVKPNETPYKTIIVEKGNILDNESLIIIENSIQVAKKFLRNKKTPKWSNSILKDFQVIDLSLIKYAVEEVV